MKQNKIVNINVKVRFNRKPSRKEKMDLVKFIAEKLDIDDSSLYSQDFAEVNEPCLQVEHHYVTVRKMGVIR